MRLRLVALAVVLVSGCAGHGPPILSPFGATAGRYTAHQGVDWAGRIGQPVYAAVDGDLCAHGVWFTRLLGPLR